ncbi:MAG: hypothetical protein QM722_21355 [Piscinibacter sp.]
MIDDFLKGIEPRIEALMQEVLGVRIDSERNRGLRRDIALRFLSQLLADDERAQLYGLPASCRVRENTKLLMPEKLVCGENVWIGENAYLDASGGLSIGDHATIGVGVYVWTHTSILANLLRENSPGGAQVIRRPTVIGKRLLHRRPCRHQPRCDDRRRRGGAADVGGHARRGARRGGGRCAGRAGGAGRRGLHRRAAGGTAGAAGFLHPRRVPMRVFVGPLEVAGIGAGFVQGLRANGASADLVCAYTHRFAYGMQAVPSRLVRWWTHWGTRRAALPASRPLAKGFAFAMQQALGWAVLAWALPRYDAFVFLYGETITNTGLELLLLRWWGKRTLVVFVGSDARPPYIDGGWFPADRPFDPQAVRRAAARQQRKVTRLERQVSLCVNALATAHFHRRRFVDWFALGIPRAAQPAVPAPNGSTLRVLHSPSHPVLKGTAQIRAAVEALRNQGVGDRAGDHRGPSQRRGDGGAARLRPGDRPALQRHADGRLRDRSSQCRPAGAGRRLQRRPRGGRCERAADAADLLRAARAAGGGAGGPGRRPHRT